MLPPPKKGRTSVTDVHALPEEQRARYEEANVSLLLQVPIVFRERLVGLISLDEPGERRGFGEREIKLVEGIAAQAGAAIEDARLLDRTDHATAVEPSDPKADAPVVDPDGAVDWL